MALLLKNGAVFLHIPKTGGNWVTTVLYDLDLVRKRVGHKHADIDQHFTPPVNRRTTILKRAVRELLSFPGSKPFIFCFVRNPLSWYESWFKYMSQPSRQWRYWGDGHDTDSWHPAASLDGLGSSDFSQFVRNVNHKRPGFVTELFGNYTTHRMGFVGKQETLVDDLIRVLKLMNLDVDEEYIRNQKRIGVSPKLRREIVWEDSLKKEVTLLEYAGMVRYGYHSEITDGCVLPNTHKIAGFQGLSGQAVAGTIGKTHRHAPSTAGSAAKKCA